MAKTPYPIAARYPAEIGQPLEQYLLSWALLSPEQQQWLLEDLHALARTQTQVLTAMQVVSQIDTIAAGIAYQTIQTAEMMKLLYGWSDELEAFDEGRRAQFLETLAQIVSEAQQAILFSLKGR